LCYNSDMSEIRLNKFLAESGVSSRRRADELILMGRVRVGKKTVKEMGIKIDPEKEDIFIDGKKINIKKENIYYILNKPTGYITTAFDPFGRKKVTDLVPIKKRLYPVGRLDWDTSGLLVLTNDGDLTQRLTHPKYKKEKEYFVIALITNRYPKSNVKYLKKAFEGGVKLKEGIAKADKVDLLDQNGKKISFNITLHQGWNRQIRRMCEKVGLEVIALKRIRIGKLKLGDLKEGKYKKIEEKEIKKLFL